MSESKGITLIALVITIIVLLILAGVTIVTLTGQNGILKNTTEAKQETQYKNAEEKVKLGLAGSYDVSGKINEGKFEIEMNRLGAIARIIGTEATVEIDGYSFWVDLTTEEIEAIETGPVKQPENIPEYWEATRRTDEEWYSYTDIINNIEMKVNSPRLRGNMKPIKYVGEEQTGSKWANAMTQDGSMWVWIPRYAYKITEGYHTRTKEGGTIEVAFLDTNNRFLNSSDTGIIETDPSKITYTNNSQDQWLVHPAFTANADNGGGFGEITGIWVAKFEASGTNETDLAVKPGVISLRDKTVNQFYHYGKEATYGETVNLNSHMMKNSEWGMIAYLTYSRYGRNKEVLEINTNSEFYTGSTTDKSAIYTTNKSQSTTNNSTGIYDIRGGAGECTANYINNKETNLQINGGIAKGDLYGETEEEQDTSTAYKTVYAIGNTDEQNANYGANKGLKGDAIYETSLFHSSSSSWNENYSYFPYLSRSFFGRGGSAFEGITAGVFSFQYSDGARRKIFFIPSNTCFLVLFIRQVRLRERKK